ncbi:cytochrome c biogenesis protein [Neptunitalea chrysea]|uniref:Cytochrome c biogenesis protein n=2 Tax=Neptunitalea chrysea TaxID=1647581 RepID=A0A9W6B4X4_9FLAO|nr:cytochrome c biogenesis protein [Neptunitalea chrysea]
MAVLFIVFALSMAAGTFIEHYTNIETARLYIYNTKWFEAIMLFFVINFMGNITRYKLYKKEKWSILLLHLAFLFIIMGAWVTRYLGDEGTMSIPEGETANYYLSEKAYLSAYINEEGNIDGDSKLLQGSFLFSEHANNFYANNKFNWNFDFKGKPFTIEYVDFIDGAEEAFIPSENGDEYLKIVESGSGSRHEHYLKSGTNAQIHNLIFSLNKPANGAINLSTTGSEYTIESPFDGTFMRMADRLQGTLIADTIQPLMLRSLYNSAGMNFVIPDSLVRGNYDIVALPDNEVTKQSMDALIVKVTVGNESKIVKILGGAGTDGAPESVTVGKLTFDLTYGSIRKQLPFAVTLNDFIAEKYPGTEGSFSSFMSKVTVDDEKPFDYDIYMNHVLDYKGYRMFQSSFSQDMMGTVLSVNHDYWGTTITYLGYYLLYAGLMAMMFLGKTRFKELGKKLKHLEFKRKSLTTIVLILFTWTSVFAQDQHTDHEDHGADPMMLTETQVTNLIHSTTVTKEHAALFGKLIIQDEGGRMKPVNTFSSELIRKLRHTDSFEDMNADQILLSMLQNPLPWYHAPIIYIKKDNDSLHHVLGVPEKAKYVKFIDFFDAQGNYKLEPFIEEAYRAINPNQFQKEFKDADLKLGFVNRALSGEMLKIFPVPDDENNKWISQRDYIEHPEFIKDSSYAKFVNHSFDLYREYLRQAKIDGDYSNADSMIEGFKKNQLRLSKDIMPSEKKVKIELLYNKYNVFKKLFVWYMLVGSFMLIVLVTQIFIDKKWLNYLAIACKAIIIFFFILHTGGLLARWYISGHAPWSNSYESLIYVGWATMGIGLLFIKKSGLAVGATAFVTSIVLMVAHMSWVDPEIGNLVPVLNSYWLKIHVAVIVGSYGPFTLGFILGILSLFLYLISTNKTKSKIALAIQEITIINELALTVGLVMLTIGNFLGGQWANESWGRYWGWDPKETWALISIMIYAFIIHMRLVPGLRGKFSFNFLSVIAYSSIMMTYFGVNFYLSGLHSYASGDKLITPTFVYYTVGIILPFAALAYWRYRVNFKK